jgi:hypothetical protein
MKLIFLMSLLIVSVSCGNPHISSKEPPQKMVSPIQPEDETGGCGEQTQEQQQQQQQQQEDYVLIQDKEVLKLQKCKENEVTIEKALNKTSWTFDRPMKMWGTNMLFKSKSKLELFNCKEEILREFILTGDQERVGYSSLNDEVCSVSLSRL